ncbi:MAG: class I SAM-dependent methyltransferase [Nannocystaceae bacterium]|nr:class I SAM-dependent methyltransferase [bacterium]
MTALGKEALAEISASTLGHYEQRAAQFWEGTRDHDVSQNRDALLRHLAVSPARILDFGCGPGRDLIAFRDAGHEAVGLDGAASFCEMARAHSGCEVLHQDFLALRLPESDFDGIFANASLFHVPSQELPRVLEQLHEALRPEGVLFASNPRGDNVEGFNGARYGSYLDHTRWSAMVTARGFVELEHYYRPPGRPRHEQPWLATVFRKV